MGHSEDTLLEHPCSQSKMYFDFCLRPYFWLQGKVKIHKAPLPTRLTNLGDKLWTAGEKGKWTIYFPRVFILPHILPCVVVSLKR